MTKREPPETCGWCARPSNQPHRPNCPRPGEVFTATDLRNARAEATAAAEQRLVKELESWKRRAEYAEAITTRICKCPWAPNDGPRLANAPDCPIHAPDALLAAEYARLLPTQASDSKEKP